MSLPRRLRGFNRGTAVLSGIIILVIGLLTAMEGIARGLFNAPTTWSLDICQYLLIWAIFLGSAPAFQEKTHVSVDFIREGMGRRFGGPVRRGMTLLGYLFALVYTVILAWNSIDMLAFGLRLGKLTRGTVQIPIVWLYLAILAGSAFMIVTILFILVSLIRGKKDFL